MIRVEVYGTPSTKGSVRGVIGKGKAAGRVIILNDSRKAGRGKDWQNAVSMAVRVAMHRIGADTIAAGPVALTLTFLLKRPQTHYYTGKRAGVLREDAPVWVTTKPDYDKLARAATDGLTGIAVRDDCQIAAAVVRKRYTTPKFLGGSTGVVLELAAMHALTQADDHGD